MCFTTFGAIFLSMAKHWWKALAVLLVFYTIIGGFLLPVPRLQILHETIRNLYFHVTMWFGMIIILTISIVNSIMYLQTQKIKYDIVADASSKVGLLFGIAGCITGSLWARYTWGAWWVADAKLNGAAISLLFYFAYQILRSSITDETNKARIAAVYNIFAYVMFMVFIMVLPRMVASLHPGNGGNPGFGKYDLDNNMRMVFYPAIIGWTLLGIWLLNISIRIKKLQIQNE
jgi:heme exporter protein C